MSLAAESESAMIDDQEKQTLQWLDEERTLKRATLPLVIFSRQSRPRPGEESQ